MSHKYMLNYLIFLYGTTFSTMSIVGALFRYFNLHDPNWAYFFLALAVLVAGVAWHRFWVMQNLKKSENQEP